MKILHIAPTPFFADRGCHIRIFGEVRSLQENGAEVFLTTYHLGRNVKNITTFRTIKIPWYNKISVGGSWHKLYIDLLLLIISIKVVIKYKPIIIHGHLHEGALIAWLTSWFTSLGKTPVVFDVQGSLTGELKTYGMIGKKGVLNRLLFSLEKFICKIPDYIVCSSKANLKYIIEEMKVSRKKVSELIDGIHEDLFKVAEKDSLRNELKIRAKKIVVYSGSLFESKGINYLINAIPRILKKYQDVEFLIIGYPVEKVKILAKDLKVDEKIIFLDKVDFFQLAKYLSISDVAVDPKVDKAGEGSGKIVNYMGAGLPVVCFDSINNRNFLGETGIYAVSGDSDDLAEKILILLNDKTKCDDFGEKNKRRVSEQFSWNVKGKELYKIYEGLLRN